MVGYVPQDDIVEVQLTVKEALTHSANTRLALPLRDRADKVNSILLGLGLWAVQHSVIGGGDSTGQGVSGGEKKRVNIGMELVANPSVLLLDEPTTGLDATAAQDVIRCLSRMAKSRGMTVCAVLHQPRPEIAAMLDQLMLLALGGRICWLGPLGPAMQYFASLGFICPPNCDAPDFLLDILSGHARKTTDEKALREAKVTMSKSISSAAALGAFSTALDIDISASPGLRRRSAHEQEPVKRRRTVAEITDAFRRTSKDDDSKDKKRPETAADSKDRIAGPVSMRRSRFGAWSLLTQAYYFTKRGFILRVIRSNQVFVNSLSFFLAGAIVGIIFHKSHLLLEPLHLSYSKSCPNLSQNLCSNPRENEVGIFAFYNVLALGIVTGAIGVRTFGGRRKLIFWREASGGASTLAFVASEMFVDAIMVTLYTMYYTAAVQLMVPVRATYGLYWGTYVTLAFAMLGPAYVLGYLIRDLETATTSAVVVGIIVVIFEGFIPKVGDDGYMWYSFWAGRAVETVELVHGHHINTTVARFCSESGGNFKQIDGCWTNSDGDQYISYFHFLVPESHRTLEPDLARDLAVVFGLGIFIRIVAYVIIATFYNQKKL